MPGPEASGLALGAQNDRQEARGWATKRANPLLHSFVPMKVLFIGDIVGSPGRRIVGERARRLAEGHGAELVGANCETAGAGFGITPALVEELLGAGLDVLTSGNHVFDRKEILPLFEQGAADGRPLRPGN